MTHRVERTIEVLLRAYFKGELKHGYQHIGGNCVVMHMDRNNVSSLYGIDGRKASCDYETREKFVSEFELHQWAEEQFKVLQITDPDSFKGLCNVFDLLMSNIDKDYFASREALKFSEDEVDLVEQMEGK